MVCKCHVLKRSCGSILKCYLVDISYRRSFPPRILSCHDNVVIDVNHSVLGEEESRESVLQMTGVDDSLVT